MTLKIYVRDWGWEGARMIVTADPNVAYNTLIKPMIEHYFNLAMAHDKEAEKYPDESNNNPWWRDYHDYNDNGLRLCQVYDVVEGTEIETSGGG